jgi:protein-S-isoprenylcysteine O-methyltransferase Ste14
MTSSPDIQPAPVKRSFLVRYRTRIALLLFLILLPAVLYVRLAWTFQPAVQFILDAVAYVLVVLGMLMRLWSTLYIGGRKDEELQTIGPYSIVRNPLYVGSALLGLGLSVISGNPLVLLIVLIYFTAQYRTTIRHEERALTAIFGEVFLAYLQRVPSFIPKLSLYDPAPPETINLGPLYKEIRHSLFYLIVILIWQTVTALQVAGVVGVLVLFK